MRIYLHIGLQHCGAERIQRVLNNKRDRLANKSVLFAKSPGKKNHTRLYLAVTDPGNPGILHEDRGFADPAKQRLLFDQVTQELVAEVAAVQPETLIISAHQLCTLSAVSELKRLHGLLAGLSDDIKIIAHIDEQARALTWIYAEQVNFGRTASLASELALKNSKNWWSDCLALWPAGHLGPAGAGEVQAPPFWLDYKALKKHWESEFGAGSFSFRSYDAARFASADVLKEICGAFGLPGNIGRSGNEDEPVPRSAETLTRGRLLNVDLIKLLAKGRKIPRPLWSRLMRDIAQPGDGIDPGTLALVSKLFEADNRALLKTHPALTQSTFQTNTKRPVWKESPPQLGFRTTQYITAQMPAMEKASAAPAGTAAAIRSLEKANGKPAKINGLSASASKLFSKIAHENYQNFSNSRFEPHNRLTKLDEQALDKQFTPIKRPKLSKNNSGNVIVGCMKNEGPFIIEWVAYHRAMGVDDFIIYTNDCDDGTSEILHRLQQMGVVKHRNNDVWKGNSPQQHALNRSLKEDVIKNASWIAHIDVDEFINVRVGNGTLQDLFDHVPDATNIAMTWRLFGHNGIEKLKDKLVIDQFDGAAPQFCPKPHTVWGFKTMFKNIGAYEKISCHRPTKLKKNRRSKVLWVNGSGDKMSNAMKENGWRSSVKSIGYDLVQLNHYALRSAESFLIKRQRGRALHVDRSIGINYWVRMDWSDNVDVTIKRNTDRTRAEMAVLMQDKTLKSLHENAMAWHLRKVDSLHNMAEFEDLYDQALAMKLTEMERVAYALSLDVEN